jgi:hypothetical protein
MSQPLEEYSFWRNEPEVGNPHAMRRGASLSHSHFCAISKKIILNIYTYENKEMVLYFGTILLKIRADFSV